MTKIQCYIASSMDGYIAKEDHSLDWLHELPIPEGEDYGYAEFFSGVDTVVMGRNTYEEILGFGVEWPYGNCTSFVVTTNRNYEVKTPDTEVISILDARAIEELNRRTDKNVWIVGGGPLIQRFMELDAIDEFIICIIPTVIGSGFPLFPKGTKETKFELVKSESFDSGAVILTYKKSS